MATTQLGITEMVEGQQGASTLFNAAVNAIDGLGQLAVKDRDAAVPPVSPAKGDRYLIATGGSGVWTGKDGYIALYVSGWKFFAPKEGWQVYVVDEDVVLRFDGTAWVKEWTKPATADVSKSLRGDGTYSWSKVVTATTTFAVTLANDVVLCDASGGTFTATLPTAVGCTGKQVTFKRTSASNNVTIATTSSQTIDAGTTYVLTTQWAVVTVVSNGANWLLV